jgi:phosphatidylglycerol:prolipoprotein diacylglycerol transferase
VYPEIHIAGLTLQTFGIMFGLAFVAAGWLLRKRLVEWRQPQDWAYEIAFAGLVGGLIGARLWYLGEHTDVLRDDPLGSLFGGSGLTWYGGAIGGALGVFVWAWRRDFLGLALLDLAAPALMLGYAVGRIGCQLSGDGDYGKPTDLPWAMSYPDGTVPTTDQVHPTPVYETLATGALAAWLWRRRDREPAGGLFALYLLSAGLERFLVEFLRRNKPILAGLTLAQVISLVMVLAGAAWIARLRRSAPQARAASAAI